MIKLNKVNKYYNKKKQNEIHVINDVTLELPEKGMVALFGKSGCGKTTLLNVIGGLDNFEGGCVEIDGNNISSNTDYIRNKYIGYIFQNYNLNNNESCYDNVLSSLKLSGVTNPEVSDELVMTALKNVGIDKFKKRLPNTLSGGQQQRVAIARALVKNPKIILADEPTGNLDENNSIIIMNLLKRISKNHLVLLVTHEEKLVKNYCDMIINISDGKIINTNTNFSDDSLETKNKNDIYLGELEKKELVSDNAIIEYYGDDLIDKIIIKLVNNNGNLYLKVESSNVKIIDEDNEIKLKEGKYVQKKIIDNLDEFEIKNIDSYQGNKFGRLFNLKDSIKSGFVNNFVGKKKKKEKALHRLLMLFSFVIVLMTSIFGTAFKQLEKVEDSYNHNIFYVNINSKKNEELIRNELENNSYVDFTQINYNYNIGDTYLDFYLGGFETVVSNYRTNISTTGIVLSQDLITESNVISGKIKDLDEHEVVISKGLANKIIENSKFGNITTYDDLLGLYCNNFTISKKISVVVGVVDVSNSAIYLNPTYLAENTLNRLGYPINYGKNFGMEVDSGEVVCLAINGNDIPQNTDIITINGYDLKINKVIKFIEDYEQWLQLYYPSNYISEEEYFDQIIKSKYSDYSDNYNNYYDIVKNEYYFDYLDVLYSKYDEYLNELYLFNSNINCYIYFDNNIEMAKYNNINNGMSYYWAKEYKKMYNKYPKLDEVNEKELQLIQKQMENYVIHYEDDFYLDKDNNIYRDTFLLSSKDLINVSSIRGKSINKDNIIIDRNLTYLTLHSTNPEETLKWLESLDLEEFSSEYDYGYQTIISPFDMRDRLMGDIKDAVIKQVITLVVIILIMSLCMFFIMKASIMNRIKEIGIYRAIGVSKKNLIFKYLIEVIILTTFTIFVGYAISSFFIIVAANVSKSIITVLYYPWYLALFVFIFLYFISIVSGLIPIISLIRRTPSEILAKYDI